MKFQLGEMTDKCVHWFILRFTDGEGDMVGDAKKVHDWIDDAMECEQYGFYRVKDGEKEFFALANKEL